MGKNDRTVSKRPDGTWANKKDGADRAAGLHRTQSEAAKEAKEMLQNCPRTSCELIYRVGECLAVIWSARRLLLRRFSSSIIKTIYLTTQTRCQIISLRLRRFSHPSRSKVSTHSISKSHERSR
jgi:hypothetical protein